MSDAEETYHYRYTNRKCSFRPILYTERLTLTIWDVDDPRDNEFALEYFQDPAIVGTLGRPLFHTVEQIVVHRTSTQPLPEPRLCIRSSKPSGRIHTA